MNNNLLCHIADCYISISIFAHNGSTSGKKIQGHLFKAEQEAHGLKAQPLKDFILGSSPSAGI